MSVIGKLQEFKPETERFSTYVERLKLYFEANGVSEDKKVAVFLTAIGPKNYALLSDCYAPTKPREIALEDLIKTLEGHFEPTPIVIAERFHFHKRDQRAGESIADFVAELRRLATNCKFGTHLEEALRDRFVCGLNNEATQKRLLIENDLTILKAIEIATNLESVERNTHVMKSSKPGVSVEANVKAINTQPCYRCGRKDHAPAHCKFKDAVCHSCGKRGHISPACRGKKRDDTRKQFSTFKTRGRRNTTKWVSTSMEDNSDSSDDFTLFTFRNKSTPPILIDLELSNRNIVMELDTGAALSLISETTKKELFPTVNLRHSEVVLKTYTSEKITVLGEMDVDVKYGDQENTLTLLVIKGPGPSLIGRNWMSHIQFNWSVIKHTRNSDYQNELEVLLEKYKPVFSDTLGTMKNFSAHLELTENVKPKFFRPRPVPFALKDRIEQELDSLESANIITKVNFSNWAAPIVVVPKKDGKLRLCGDYKVTLNPSLEIDKYPLPKPEDLFATLSGGKVFSKIDLSQAYQQMQLDDCSKELVTVNTHRGLYRYNRLPFGVASAPALFQRAMDTVLQGIPNVICYIDDILVSGKDHSHHLKNLEEVLKRLSEEGITVKRSKCTFLSSQVEYLGHIIDSKGLHSSNKKLEAILKAPIPRNVQQLRSLLGLVNYYRKFVPNMASVLHPLNQLLRQDVRWNWTPACNKSLSIVKKKLVDSTLLVHYDSQLPLRLASDASAYGIGAVISHVFPNGTEQPIAFASRTLTPAEKNYPQIEKEALSLVFGVQKFHQYLYARKFVLVTDHKPLCAILGPKKGIPTLAAARLQRWAILLSAYTYDIEYRPTKLHGNADALSRLPLPTNETEKGVCYDSIFNLSQLEAVPITNHQLVVATEKDPVLSKIMRYTKYGWPSTVHHQLKPYFNRKTELTIEGKCLMWGIRVVIPQKYQKEILNELHKDHPGICRMKSLARSYLWWPGLDADIESLTKSCLPCLSVKPSPPKSPLNPWIWPSKPWSRLHIDFAGPLYGRTYFIIVDAHSKWPEVFAMPSTTTSKTIEVLRLVFSTYGLPDQIVSDNGPQFTSEDFQMFLKNNGVKHIRSAPYHPATNGLAERFVQTLKKAIVAGKSDSRSHDHKLASFLLKYRTTPHTVTGVPPSTLFLGRQLKTVLDLLKPNTERRVLDKQSAQKEKYDQHSSIRLFEVGDLVMVKTYRENRITWLPGTVSEKQGEVSFIIKMSGGNCRRCHIDQIRKRQSSLVLDESTLEDTSETTEHSTDFTIVPNLSNSNRSTTDNPSNDESLSSDSQRETMNQSPNSDSNIGNTSNPQVTDHDNVSEPRYPKRVRKPPDRYF